MKNTLHELIFLPLMLLTCAASAANHSQRLAPLPVGPYPVACSNVAQDQSAVTRLGGTVDDYWEGSTDNQSRYISQILAEPQGAIMYNLHVPDDGDLYNQYHNKTLPVVSLVCYPTSAGNKRADYALPDGQLVPHMERSGDQPIFPDSGRYPALVYSHGLGSSPFSNNSLGSIARFASYGYVVMAVFHADARITKIHVDDVNDAFHVLLHFDDYTEMQALRPLELKYALNDLLDRTAYASHIDTNKIGGFGASLGGEAVLLSMGATLTDSVSLGTRRVENDPRIKAAVGYAPYCGQSFLPAFGRGEKGALTMNKPFLAMTGTADTTAPIDMTSDTVKLLPASHYLVAMTDVKHQYLPEYADDVFGWFIPFLDAYVKDDPAALARLEVTAGITGGLDDNLRIDSYVPRGLEVGQVLVTEFRNTQTNNFLNAIDQPEVNLVSAYANKGWERTGQLFKAWLPNAVTFTTPAPVCRYYHASGTQILDGTDTLYYTTFPALCAYQQQMTPPWFYLGTAFYMARPSASGECPLGTLAINRAYNNALNRTLNYRFTSSNSEMRVLTGQGWTLEPVDMCAPL